MEAALISEKGMRPEMEDAHFLDMNFAGKGWAFGGIYDGHGGYIAAVYASRRLHLLFLEKINGGKSSRNAFIESYEAVSDELKIQNSGTTAVNFFIRDGIIVTAHAGDARALVIDKGDFHQLTVDHRVDNSEEVRRIREWGGVIGYPYVYKGTQGLMPTRTIGDQYFKSVGIIATPSVSEYRIKQEDRILLAACDGLFDFMENKEVADFCRRYPDPERLVETLKSEVLVNRSGTDNLTIIAVKLQH